MFSFGLGVSSYHGDLHDVVYDGLGSAVGSNLGIGLRKKFGSQISMRLDLNWYGIGGDDADSGFLAGKDPDQRGGPREGQNDTRFVRNLSFSSRNLEASLFFTFNLIPVNGSYTRRPVLNPYLLLGIGITTNNPTAETDALGKVNLRHLNTEALPGLGYSGTAMVIPLGIGIRLKATQYVDILFEAARRFTFTDYLDDVSTEFPSLQELRDAGRIGNISDAEILFDRSAEAGYPTRKPGDDRGNPEKNDAYYIFQVRLELYLPDNFIKQLFQPSRRKPKFR
ncbi:MAG: hypothetical protein Roseis2KO_01820 [Roseivirga sp.]